MLLPNKLNPELFEILTGLILGDASIYRTKTNNTFIKFEYSYKHEDYAIHLHNKLKSLTYSESPSVYFAKKGSIEEGKPFSSFFYTFSHNSLNFFWDLFMVNGKKTVKPNLVLKYLNEKGLAYWILDDGSYNKSKGYITLHTEGFTLDEVCLLCAELNQKFNLDTKPMEKKNYKNKNQPSYWIIYIPKASVKILSLLKGFCETIQSVPSLAHKIPKNLT